MDMNEAWHNTIKAIYWGAGPMILRTYLRNLKDEPKGERFWE